MALVICPECGKKISEYAVSCPNCGCPMSQIKKLLTKNRSSVPVQAKTTPKPAPQPATAKPNVSSVSAKPFRPKIDIEKTRYNECDEFEKASWEWDDDYETDYKKFYADGMEDSAESGWFYSSSDDDEDF